MKSNEKTRFWMKKSWATLIFHEKPWKNHDFHAKSAKNLEFLGFCAPRKQKTENHTRWGPEGAPPEAERQKAALRAAERSLLAQICGFKVSQERCFHASLKIFLDPKIGPVSAPTDWANSRNIVTPTMKSMVFEDFGRPREGPEGGSRRLGGRQGRVTRELSSQGKQNKENHDF